MLVSSSDIFSIGKQTLMNRKQNVYGNRDADCQWLDNGSCRCLLTSVPVWWISQAPHWRAVSLCVYCIKATFHAVSLRDLGHTEPSPTPLCLSALSAYMWVYIPASLMSVVWSDQPGPPQSLLSPASATLSWTAFLSPPLQFPLSALMTRLNSHE